MEIFVPPPDGRSTADTSTPSICRGIWLTQSTSLSFAPTDAISSSSSATTAARPPQQNSSRLYAAFSSSVCILVLFSNKDFCNFSICEFKDSISSARTLISILESSSLNLRNFSAFLACLDNGVNCLSNSSKISCKRSKFSFV